MIKFIAALDNQRGIADDRGIPWQGLVPGDIKYYRRQLRTAPVLMGYGLYKELSKPYPGVVNYVATHDANKSLRAGFERVPDASKFLREFDGDIWNAGGAVIFDSTFDLADELYLTLLNKDFQCTKFFPAYEDSFKLVRKSEPLTENGITYHFTVWRRK